MNSSHSRLKRAAPERSGPKRNPLVSAANGAASKPASIANAALGGPLECGVRTAYAVIDEYMRRGYEAARSQERHTGESNMNNEKPNYGNFFNPWGPAAPMMEQWATAMRAWTEAWSAFIPGMAQTGWGQQAYGCPPPGYPAGASSPQPVSVWVSSQRPVEVTVNLKPGYSAKDLTADSFVPPLVKSISIQRKEGRLHVSVPVANEQAVGRYTGVIRCSDGSIAGDLTVVISDAAKYAG